jgi:hypothetical protein
LTRFKPVRPTTDVNSQSGDRLKVERRSEEGQSALPENLLTELGARVAC